MNQDLLFDDSESAVRLAPVIASAVESGRMPPFYAEETEECPNPWGWQHDPRLSGEEEALLLAWADGGAPVGDPGTAAVVTPPPAQNLEDPDTTLSPVKKWTTGVIGSVEDEFVCFSLDPGTNTQKWLEAFQVIPDDDVVVHHVLVGVDQEGESAALAGPDGFYDCFGGFGVDASFIGGWVPGARPTEFPEHSGYRVAAGARIVLQMHYHLVGEPRQDGTSLAIRWKDETPVREAYVFLTGNAESERAGLQPGDNDENGVEFRIPAGEAAHVETQRFDLWEDYERAFKVFLVANHMHYVGTSMRMWLERGSQTSGRDEVCLLHTPGWDFDWQQFYFYDVTDGLGPTVYQGDSLWLECEYNNTLENPQLESALEENGLTQPIDVSLGEGTLDEMCIGVIGQVFDVPLSVDDATHGGGVEVQIASTDYGFDTACEGPASVRIGSDGTMEGVAACGLDLGELLATVEVDISGEVSTDGTASGELNVNVVGVSGTATSAWTGTLDGDTLTISVSAGGVFGGGQVSFAGEVTVREGG